MIITQTPFRMSFFGGGTDFPDFYKEHGGAVISTTFDKYCYVNVRHLPRFFDYSTELSYSKIERVTDVNDINHPAIREAMKYLDMQEIRLTYEADLPARSGLGTSSSFAVGMLNAFYALKGKYAASSCPFDPDRRTPAPLSVTLAHTHVIIIGIALGLVVDHVVSGAESRLGLRAFELHSLREPSAQEMRTGALQQFGNRMFVGVSVELGDELRRAGSRHVEDHALHGRGHDVGILRRIHVERHALRVALHDTVDARVELKEWIKV